MIITVHFNDTKRLSIPVYTRLQRLCLLDFLFFFFLTHFQIRTSSLTKFVPSAILSLLSVDCFDLNITQNITQHRQAFHKWQIIFICILLLSNKSKEGSIVRVNSTQNSTGEGNDTEIREISRSLQLFAQRQTYCTWWFGNSFVRKSVKKYEPFISICALRRTVSLKPL